MEYLFAYPSSMLFSLSFFLNCVIHPTHYPSPHQHTVINFLVFYWVLLLFKLPHYIHAVSTVSAKYMIHQRLSFSSEVHDNSMYHAHMISANAVVGYLSCSTSLYIFSAPLESKREGCVASFVIFKKMKQKMWIWW